MSFQQLNTIIPVFKKIEMFHDPCQIMPDPGYEKLIIIRKGYLLIITNTGESKPVSHGYACHSSKGPVTVQLPSGRQAEYVVITYGIVPVNTSWNWDGPLRLLSGIKVQYMVDALLQLETSSASDEDEDESHASRFRSRMMLARILYFFMYESRISDDLHSADTRIEKSVQYIEEHYMLRLTLTMLAERASLSPGHFSVRFKERMGMTVSHYLKQLRIEKAKELFELDRMSPKQAAQSVGFADYFHFSRTFKNVTGKSPVEYIRDLKRI